MRRKKKCCFCGKEIIKSKKRGRRFLYKKDCCSDCRAYMVWSIYQRLYPHPAASSKKERGNKNGNKRSSK